jgi:hypothetical protein
VPARVRKSAKDWCDSFFTILRFFKCSNDRQLYKSAAESWTVTSSVLCIAVTLIFWFVIERCCRGNILHPCVVLMAEHFVSSYNSSWYVSVGPLELCVCKHLKPVVLSKTRIQNSVVLRQHLAPKLNYFICTNIKCNCLTIWNRSLSLYYLNIQTAPQRKHNP